MTGIDRIHWRTLCTGLAILGCLTLPATAQEKLELPSPETMTLATGDGVAMRCTYYPGGVIEAVSGGKKQYMRRPGKEVVPVVLVHDWGGRGRQFDYLASFLQRLGHAVLSLDLRGHGDSKTVVLPNGREREIDPDRMRPAEINSMVRDIQRAKKFFMELNNAGEVNIEMLCLVGAGLGATLSVNWSVIDWSWPQLPGRKQGRDVKAIVMLSPRQSYKGVSMTRSLQHPVVRDGLSYLMAVGGEDSKGVSDVNSILKRVERGRKEPVEPRSIKWVEGKTLYVIEPPVKLRGVQLVDPRARLKIHQEIAKFLHVRLVMQKDRFKWQARTNPIEETE